MKISRLSVLSLLALAGCGAKSSPSAAVTEPNPFAELETSIQAAMNPAISPCDDFYEYACGGWLASNEIPGDEARWSRGFSIIYQRNEDNIRKLIRGAAESEAPTEIQAKVGAYFNACMDVETINSRGVEPLVDVFKSIDAIANIEDLFRVNGEVQAYDTTPLFGLGVGQDYKNPEMVLLQLSQGGLGLPEKNFYVGPRVKPAQLEAYVAHVAKMLELSGMEAAAATDSAKGVLAFETRLAELAKERSELRDANKTYHPMNREELQAMSEELPWGAFLEGIGDTSIVDFNVNVPSFFEGLSVVLAETDIAVLRAYMRWHVVHGMANRLSQDFVDENFAFYGTTLSGTQEQPERWKRCVRSTSKYLDEEVGQLYVAEHFAGDSKEIALDMITRVEGAFEAALPELSWMDELTRERAVGKARAITNKIGYPDKWRDLASVTVSGDDYFGNSLAISRYDFKQYMDKVGHPPDRAEWYMAPQVVNAYYNPAQNEIVFPAGILQDPFFSAANPRAINFGAMGMVMGHEISHGFDDSGRKFSATGVLEEWWEPEVSKRFDERAECIVEQYSGYQPLEGKGLNGRLTLGENIADNGGMKQSYSAYKKWLDDNGREPDVAGFTNEQLFFIGGAQSWCSLITPELAEQYLVTDPHSPPKFRLNGSVTNFPAFAEAFDCPADTPMNPTERCEVW